ncbi:MAG: ABC transporter permease [Acidimicrobiia bacterium]
MKGLAGVGALTRLILRRDRVRLLVWILAVVGLMVSFAASSVDLYPTPESLQARAVIMDSPLGVAFSGPRIGLDNYTFGAMLSNEYVGFVAVALALMSVFLVVRNTRVEEQTGRAELVRAAVVGRNAAATATLLVVVGAQLVIGVLIALLLPGTGLDLTVEGSWLFAAAVVSVGVVFAAVALVAAQVTSHSRTAVGVGAAAVGAAYLIRAIGDVGDSALSMLSPIGWAQVTKPFVADAWWPLLISVGFFVVTTWVAFALSARRDLGEGLVAARPGPADAEPALGRPLGLAFRLQKGLLIGWGVGLFVLAASYGGFVADVERFASENPFIEEALSAIGGGTLGENWASFLALFMVALVSSFAVQAILRLRSEEVGQRAEPVLATPLDRWRWMGSHLLVAAVGSIVLAAVVGLGFGLTAAATTGEWSWVPRSIGAAFSHLPALAVVAGVAVALFGLLPRLTSLAWVMIAVVWIGLVGVIVGLPEWVSNLSPFGYGALVPAVDIEPVPLLVLSAIAVVLMTVGFLGFRRRDVGVG